MSLTTHLREFVDAFYSIVFSIFKPRFIFFHAVYVIVMSFVGSIMLYPIKNIRYIDCLFLASGAVTQAGLNTIDLNTITTWQQIVLFLIPLVTNPVAISTFLVFIRLYWFEKAFHNIRQQSLLEHRQRKDRMRTVDRDYGGHEQHTSVAGRPIRIVHSARMTEENFPGYMHFKAPDLPENKEYSSSLQGSLPASEHGSAIDEGSSTDDSNNISPWSLRNNQMNVVESETTDSSPVESTDTTAENKDLPATGIHRDIRFGDLPSPRNRVVQSHSYSNLENGPPLVIKSPRELAAEVAGTARQPTTGIHFDNLPTPMREPALLQRSSYSSLEGHGPALVIKSPREQEKEAEAEEAAAALARQNGDPEIHFAISPVAGHVRPGHGMPDMRRKSGNTESHDWPGKPKSAYRRVSHHQTEDLSLQNNHVNSNDDPDHGRRLRPTQSHTENSSARPEDEPRPAMNRRAMTIEAPESAHERVKPKQRRNSIADMFLSRPFVLERKITGTTSGARENSPTRSMMSHRGATMQPLYLSRQVTVAKNSTFLGLTEEMRAELGGVEYQALRTLAVVLIGYVCGFWILANVSLIPWIMNSRTYKPIVLEYSQSPAWWGAFMSVSAFMDVGYSIIPTSMIEFATAVFPLLLMAFLVVIGNTGFPCMLRLIIWLLRGMFRHGSRARESLTFLLEHPRRCFILLFPSAATWWLFLVLIVLNGLDLILFIVLDLNNTVVTGWNSGERVLAGLFQAISTRTAGLTVVDLADLHPAVQVSYLIMMYISVLPIAISVRRTNVYEDLSLGIYGPGAGSDEHGEDGGGTTTESDDDGYVDEDDDGQMIHMRPRQDSDIESVRDGHISHARLSSIRENGAMNGINEPEKRMLTRRASSVRETLRETHENVRRRQKSKKKDVRPSFLSNHLRRQLSFDLWYIFLGLFIICIADGDKIQDDSSFTIYAVLFEVVSAYGTVGLSLGYPNTNASLSAQFSTVSKLVIVAMMWRGRHRGLPYALDRAVMLPNNKILEKDKQQEGRLERYLSVASGEQQLPRYNTRMSTRGRNSVSVAATGTSGLTRTMTTARMTAAGRGAMNVGVAGMEEGAGGGARERRQSA
ncbi:cation transport protein-domain-containing protein [Limtongia smithiae]|uniref:cation transport protein-domain-containing protein n=1 Tax=Limtongia smithiae TaxID=1125753 RepID=UPI0034CF8D8B